MPTSAEYRLFRLGRESQNACQPFCCSNSDGQSSHLPKRFGLLMSLEIPATSGLRRCKGMQCGVVAGARQSVIFVALTLLAGDPSDKTPPRRAT